jgi:hypothetical protein
MSVTGDRLAGKVKVDQSGKKVWQYGVGSKTDHDHWSLTVGIEPQKQGDVQK